MPVEAIIFESESTNRQGARCFQQLIRTGGQVEDVTGDDRAAVDVAVGTELIRVSCPFTPGLKAASSARAFRVRGNRYSIRSRDYTDYAEVAFVGERVGA